VDAIEQFSTAISWADGVADFYAHRGEAYMQLQKLQPAHTDFRAALSLNPRHQGALRWMSSVK
jgi:Tfp pilus assembly protein PilF